MVYTIGIIGTGFGKKVHLPAFQHHPDFEVKIIAGRDYNKTKSIANKAEIEHTTNWEDIIKDPQIDLVSISTPPYLHYTMAKASIKAKKHILLEKPTASNVQQAKKLLILAESNNVLGLIAHEFRWQPQRMMLRKLLRDDKIIGQLREIHVNQYLGFAASQDRPKYGWLWDSKYDGGLLGAFGSHLIDMIRSSTGLEFSSILGKTFTRTPIRKKEQGKYIEVTSDDGFSATIEMNEGVNGSMSVSGTLSPTPASRIIIGGSNGTCVLEGGSINVGRTGEEFTKIIPSKEFELDNSLANLDRRIPPFLKLLDQLSLSLKNKESMEPNLFDGWKNQQVVDAIRLSEKLGTHITLNDYI